MVVIGKKQILRQLKENNLKSIQIATDVEKEYADSIIAVARLHNVKVEIKDTMAEIALQYGIDVPSGAVGVLKD